MANHNLPVLTSTYTNFVSELDARFDDLAVGLDPAVTTATNVPTNSIRWNSALAKWQKWSGAAWGDLSATYNFTAGAFTTLSASGTTTITAPTAISIAITGGLIEFKNTGGATRTGYIQEATGNLAIVGEKAGSVVDTYANNTKITTVSSTGLAVTGALSASGDLLLQNSYGYGSSPNKSLILGGSDNGYVNNGTEVYWQHYQSGDATSQTYKIRPYLRASGYVDCITLSRSGLSLNGSFTITGPSAIVTNGLGKISYFADDGGGDTLVIGNNVVANPVAYSNTLNIANSGHAGSAWKMQSLSSSYPNSVTASLVFVEANGDNSTRLAVSYSGLAVTGAASVSSGNPLYWGGIGSTTYINGSNASNFFEAVVGGIQRGLFNASGLAVSGAVAATGIVSAGNGAALRAYRHDGATYAEISHGPGGVGNVYNDPNGDGHFFQLGGANSLILNSAGNFGLGVAPSAWGSINRALDIGNMAFTGRTDGANAGASIAQNCYRDSSDVWRYKATGYSLRTEWGGGSYYWYTAPSGTAGDPITFTQAMTLDASGFLLLGATSYSTAPNGGITMAGGVARVNIGHSAAGADGNDFLQFSYNGSRIGGISQLGTTGISVNSPATLALTGTTVTAPTPATTDNSTSVATTAFVAARAIPQSATSVSLSGTAVDFTGIPSWVKRITIMLQGASTNGSSLPVIRIGDGSIVSTGYLGSNTQLADTGVVNANTETTGFTIRSAAASYVVHGALVLTLITGNTWVASGVFANSAASINYTTAGSLALSTALDRVRLTTINGTDTFDAGTINIMYE